VRGAVQWQGQLGMVRRWYEPQLQRLYDAAPVRSADLEQLEPLAGASTTRESFLSELTLDPPSALGDEAAPPHLDEDYLILSTIHSAKGQEWDVVYVLNVVDGCIPSDMATGTPQEIEEERRLLYVAMTRARGDLYLMQPHRFHTRGRPDGDNHVYAPQSRFIPDALLALFERRVRDVAEAADSFDGARAAPVNLKARLREMWR
jgi:DNA helicase-2/ATP-dependent DNA helicase PcrA